jgi:hypothetical protein
VLGEMGVRSARERRTLGTLEMFRIKPDSRGHKLLKAISGRSPLYPDYETKRLLKLFAEAGLVTTEPNKLTDDCEQALYRLKHGRIYRKP